MEICSQFQILLSQIQNNDWEAVQIAEIDNRANKIISLGVMKLEFL